jgi:predicted RNase H-like HicB family nuclease
MSFSGEVARAVSRRGGRLSLNCVVSEDPIDGGYIAECVDIPGCMSQGDTIQEANRNLADALSSCIAIMIEDALKAAARSQPCVARSDRDVLEQFTVRPLVEELCVG